MDLRQLSYVIAIVDTGTFTGAARAMQVAQPSLSQAVRTLEAELGVELFHRGARSVTLTAAGEALVEPARQALRDASTAREAVAAVAGLQAGHLDIVCLPTLAVHPAAGLIGGFRRDHPGVTVRVAEPEDTDAVADRVRNASSEIGLTELPVAGPGLITHPLEVQEYVALIPSDLKPTLTSTGRITIRELAEQPLVTSPRGTSTRRLIDDAFLAAGLQARVAVETDHREAIGPLVNAGGGAAVLPRALAEHTASAGVVTAEIVPRLARSIGLIHRAGPLSPAAQAFVDLAVQTGPESGRPRPRRRA